MWEKNFIELLKKYGSNNENNIRKFIDNYEDIIRSITNIQEVVANKISEEIVHEARKDIMEEICNDAQKLKEIKKEYQNVIQILEESTITTTQLEIADTIKSDIENDKIPIYVIADKTCPLCMTNIKYTPITYKDYRKKGKEYSFKGYKCFKCGKEYVLDTDLLDLTDTNVELITDFYNRISLHDVIVLSNINKCGKHNHKIEDTVGVLLTISNEGKIIEEEVALIYCNNCKKYTILKSEYERIKGTPLCEIIDETKTANTNAEFDYTDKGGSKLARHGYNVNCVDKLTKIQRETILGIQLASGNMTKGEIMSYIDANIENGLKRSNSQKSWDNAINKWKSDREYVRNFNLDTFKKRININRFILKYSKRKNNTMQNI